MSDFDSEAVDWRKVRGNLGEADVALRAAEEEIAKGFDTDENPGLASLAYDADIPHDIDELIKGVTNSSSHLRNGTLNYIPDK